MTATNGHDILHDPKLNEETPRGPVAIVISISVGCGPNRQMQMQFGVPLDMTPKELNRYVDKAMGIADRQSLIGALDRAKLDLEGAKRQLITQREQKANYVNGQEANWYNSGRKGKFMPAASEQAQIANWDKSIRELQDNRIPKFEQEIAELERTIAAGV